jgi:hypothetical protein
VISAYNARTDRLWGHAGDDCVDDRTDAWNTFSCGENAGDNDDGTSLPGDCENSISCCEAVGCGTEGPAGGGEGPEPEGGTER